MKYERIRSMRVDRDLTQKMVAQYLNVGRRTYCGYEIGNRNWPDDILLELAKFYNTSVDYLVGLTDDPTLHQRAKKKTDAP